MTLPAASGPGTVRIRNGELGRELDAEAGAETFGDWGREIDDVAPERCCGMTVFGCICGGRLES